MPFQFNFLPVEAYRSPYAQAIADATGGADRARAKAAQASGEAIAGAVGHIASTVAQLPQQVQRQQIDQTQQKSAGLDLQAKQRAEDARKALSDVMQSTPKLSEDGVSVWDVPAITRTLADKGFGPEAGAAAQHLDGINNAFRQTRAAQLGVVQKGAQAVAAAGNDPALASHFLDQLEANQIYPKDQIQKFRAFVSADPANVEKLTSFLMGPQKMETAAPGSSARSPLTGKIVPGSTAPDHPPAPSAAEFAAIANDPNATPDKRAAAANALKALQQNPAAAETARHDRAMEEISRLTAGRAAAAQAETVRHNRVMEDPLGLGGAAPAPGAGAMPAGGGAAAAPVVRGTAADPAAGAPPEAAPSPATGGRNEAALAKLPPPVEAQVRAIAEGKRAVDARSISTPAGRQLLSLVYAYDPSFDQVNYNARFKTRTDFTSGASSKNVNALNTVIGHLSELSDAADALHNTWSPTWNSIANAVSSGTGHPEVKKFETIQNAVADEATRVWRQAGGTESDIKSWKHDLDAAGSPEQLHGVIATIGDLLQSKLDALQTQYQQGMGATDIKVIAPAAEKALEVLRGRAGKPGAPASGITVSAPSGGKSYSFKTQGEADAFVAAAKQQGLWK